MSAGVQEIVTFKTGAWQSSAMVENYAARMHSTDGTNRLKNEVELSHIQRNVTGENILDVGVGTGRAALPLAAAGYRVTGVDASAAMLDQCRREAGATAITLQQAELTNLPFPDASFDSVVSLNVAVHFPNWRDALREWARVTRPGGRIVFDIHSKDHLNAVAAQRGISPDALLTDAQKSNAGEYMERIQAAELSQAANGLGLSLVSALPYGMLLGGGNINYWLTEGLLTGYLGDRALSWMSVDARLYAFAAFVEQEIAVRLSTSATTRFMAVVEKRSDAAASHAAIADPLKREQALLRGDAAAFFGDASTDCMKRLRQHLEYAPNRVLAAMALSDPVCVGARGAVSTLLGDDTANALYDANDRLAVEREAERALHTIRARISGTGAMSIDGVDYASTLDYEEFRSLLERRYFAKDAAP